MGCQVFGGTQTKFQSLSTYCISCSCFTAADSIKLARNVNEDDLKLAFLDLDEFVPVYDAKNNAIIELL